MRRSNWIICFRVRSDNDQGNHHLIDGFASNCWWKTHWGFYGTFFFLEIKTSKPSPGLLNPFLIRLILNEKVPKKRVESNFLDIFQQMLKNSPQNSLCAVCACSYKNSKRLVAPLESAKTFEGASYAPGSKTVDASNRWPRKSTYHINPLKKWPFQKEK